MRRKVKTKANSRTNTLAKSPIPNFNDKAPIRVLYKKVGQAPKVKIINDVTKLKYAVVKQNLKLIPYENLYIICKNPKIIQNMRTNIVLTFCSIYGDFILVDIDRKKREFKSLKQEDLVWFTTDLINKSPISNLVDTKQQTTRKLPEAFERDFDNTKYMDSINFLKSTQFENTLINVLVNLELVLANILKNNDTKK